MNSSQKHFDVIVIGAGAAGLMAAWKSGERGLKTLLIEHTNKIGEKIRISGGGRCNFTNIHASAKNYISHNPHFVKSALSQYSQHDFIKLVESHNISYFEKTLGQLFCHQSSRQIIDMMVNLCKKNNVTILQECVVDDVQKNDFFCLQTNCGELTSSSLIIASGGLSIPKIGASNFGYNLAKKFGLGIVKTEPALVPLITKDDFSVLSGVSLFAKLSYQKTSFEEDMLFTHKGISGPSILQISSYLNDLNNDVVHINLLPKINLEEEFLKAKNSKQNCANFLKQFLPNRFVDHIATDDFQDSLTDLRKSFYVSLSQKLHHFPIAIQGSEGYLKAEVTKGGVDTNHLSSKTMMSKDVPGLFFVGEVVDVTGWLGGYNFQWAWSSGYVAGQNC